MPLKTVSELETIAAGIRCDIIKMIESANAGHPGGSLSAADIVTALYFRVMRIQPDNPAWPDRDRFILSKGHACPVWYAALARRGYFDTRHLTTLRRLNSILQGHPDMNKTPGVDMTVGSLGHGLSAAVGMALGGQVRNKNYKVWVVIGDGEAQEGSIWEAAMAAAKWKLGTLIAIMDCNRLQNDGYVDEVMPIALVADKWRAFGWKVLEIDGHNMSEIVDTLENTGTSAGTPTMVLANTVKGKGVSFMEDVCEWHGRAPTHEEAQQALKELMSCKS
jgi:transketolase